MTESGSNNHAVKSIVILQNVNIQCETHIVIEY